MSVASQVSDDLLDALGLENWDHAPASLSRRGLAALNQTLQQIYAVLPDDFWSRKPIRAETIHEPTTISVNVSPDSKEIEFGAGWEDWMKGCTIVIAGDAVQNRLVSDDDPEVTLWQDYQGSGDGTTTAIIYQDRIHVPDAEEILGPVILQGHWELSPVQHERHRQASNARAMSHGSKPSYAKNLFPLTSSERVIGVPQSYLIQPFAEYQSGARLSLLLDALPNIRYSLTMEVKAVAPSRVTTWEDPRSYLVPHNYTESILLPMVRFSMASHPSFPRRQQDLKPDFDAATKILQSLKPAGFIPSVVAVGSDW